MSAARVSGPLSDDVVAAFLQRCRAEWREAGLGEHVEDAALLDRIATTVTGATRNAPVKG
jgi:hypothetical protein